MKNSVALGWALGLLPALAAAETTIYGEIKGGLSTTSQSAMPVKYGSDQTQTPYLSHNQQTQVDDYGSFIGLRGQEQLGDTGVKAIWQIEQDIPISQSRRRR